MKSIKYILTITLILLSFTSTCFAIDIEVSSVVLKYRDDVTTEGEVVIRELQSLQDNTYWSKPYEVDIEVKIKNIGTKSVRRIRVKPELYYSLRALNSKYPAMNNELKEITNKPVWVWVNNLGNEMIKSLEPGESKIIIFQNRTIRSEYYATDYFFQAFAVKVFAESIKGNDVNYSNNVNQKIIQYGD